MTQGKKRIIALAGLACLALVAGRALAQEAVPDISHCADGSCIVIGEKQKSSSAVEFNVHLFPAGRVPRAPGGGRKAKRNFYDDITKAVAALSYFTEDELRYCAPKGTTRSAKIDPNKTTNCPNGKVGRVYVHPGDYDMPPVLIRNYPKSVIFEGAELDIGPALLFPQRGQCFTIMPNYAQDDEGRRIETAVGFKSLVIGFKRNSVVATNKDTDCIATSRVNVEIDNVQMMMNGHKGNAVHLFNRKATITRSEFLAKPFGDGGIADVDAFGGRAILVNPEADLSLSGVGPSRVTVSGFETGLDARAAVAVKGVGFAYNYEGIVLRPSGSISTVQKEKKTSISQSAFVVDGAGLDPNDDPAVGVLVAANYDGDVTLESVRFSSPPIGGGNAVGLLVDENVLPGKRIELLGLSAADKRLDGQGPAFSSEVAFMPKGVELWSSATVESTTFRGNDTALSLQMARAPRVELHMNEFLGNDFAVKGVGAQGGQIDIYGVTSSSERFDRKENDVAAENGSNPPKAVCVMWDSGEGRMGRKFYNALRKARVCRKAPN